MRSVKAKRRTGPGILGMSARIRERALAPQIRALGLSALLVWLPGCTPSSDPGTPTPNPADLDGDGYTAETGDCDDTSSSVHPAAEEVCNGRDDNCDEHVDPGCDDDRDGFESEAAGGSDCDDSSAAVYPGALERCDALDNNCDNILDNAIDLDGDGFAPCGSEAGEDCDDQDAAVYPGAAEVFDGQPNACESTGTQEVLSTTAARVTLVGEYAGDRAGSSVGALGDLNGDGYDDLFVGAPFSDGGALDAGKVYVLFGGPGYALGLAGGGKQTTLDLSYANLTLWGAAQGDAAGAYVAGIGDVNADGFDDLWVGAPGAGDGSGIGYLILGRQSFGPILNLDSADASFPGPTADGGFGVVSSGDVNGDGVSDLLLGAPEEDAGTGAAYLLLGGADLPTQAAAWTSSALRLGGLEPGGRFGASLALQGDLEGDGFSDLVIGAPGIATVYVLFGASSLSAISPPSEAEIVLIGEPGSLAGFSVSSEGDLNADGYADVLLGAPGANAGAGAVFGILGKPSGLAVALPMSLADLRLEGDVGTGLGSALGTRGDLEGDEIDDLVIGTSSGDSAWLVPGRTQNQPLPIGPIAEAATARVQGDLATGLGTTLALCGDLNADGHLEWLIGAPQVALGGDNAGAAYIYFGYSR